MMSLSACLPRSATDQLGPHQSARPATSYTMSWDIIQPRHPVPGNLLAQVAQPRREARRAQGIKAAGRWHPPGEDRQRAGQGTGACISLKAPAGGRRVRFHSRTGRARGHRAVLHDPRPAAHGADLDPDEIAQALKIKVREVNVYGEPAVNDGKSSVIAFAEVFRPSRAFPGSFGERTSYYEDGEAFLYLAVYEGDGHALLGRKKSFGDKSVALKVGVTNALKRRCAELNAGIPPAATGRWVLRVNSQPFPDKKSAEDVEAQFKQLSSGRLESLGGEFFWGNLEEAKSLCWSLPGMSRF